VEGDYKAMSNVGADEDTGMISDIWEKWGRHVWEKGVFAKERESDF
jgi:hypothetical protein